MLLLPICSLSGIEGSHVFWTQQTPRWLPLLCHIFTMRSSTGKKRSCKLHPFACHVTSLTLFFPLVNWINTLIRRSTTNPITSVTSRGGGEGDQRCNRHLNHHDRHKGGGVNAGRSCINVGSWESCQIDFFSFFFCSFAGWRKRRDGRKERRRRRWMINNERTTPIDADERGREEKS